MLHDKYDGTVGFAINGGIKDATQVLPWHLFISGDCADLRIIVTSVA